MKHLALTIGGTPIQPPLQVPEGGLTSGKTPGVGILRVGITLLLLLAILLSLAYIVIGGFKWITSGGDKQKLESARMTIIYAIVGLVIAFFAFLIINIISAVIGVNLLFIQVV
jgi:hypothetical protein